MAAKPGGFRASGEGEGAGCDSATAAPPAFRLLKNFGHPTTLFWIGTVAMRILIHRFESFNY